MRFKHSPGKMFNMKDEGLRTVSKVFIRKYIVVCVCAEIDECAHFNLLKA